MTSLLETFYQRWGETMKRGSIKADFINSLQREGNRSHETDLSEAKSHVGWTGIREMLVHDRYEKGIYEKADFFIHNGPKLDKLSSTVK